MAMLNCTNDTMWSDNTSKCFKNTINIKKNDLIVPKCIPYTGEVCKNNTPEYVYIPYDTKMSTIESTVKSLQFSFALATHDTGCIKRQQALVCGTNFVQCEKKNINNKVFYLPKLLSYSICKQETCSKMYSINDYIEKSTRYDCDSKKYRQLVYNNGTIYQQGLRNFPETETIFINGGKIKLSTSPSIWDKNDNIPLSAITTNNAICPYPLALPDTEVDDSKRIYSGSCVKRVCPYTEFDNNQISVYSKTFEVLSAFSFICSLLILVTW